MQAPPALPGAHSEDGSGSDDFNFATDEGTPLLPQPLPERHRAMGLHGTGGAAAKWGSPQCEVPGPAAAWARRCHRRLVGTVRSWISRETLLTLVYVLTGAAQPTLTDSVRRSGGAGAPTPIPLLLPMLANTAGMAGVGLMYLCPGGDTDETGEVMVVAPRPWERCCASWRRLAVLLAVDLASSTLILLGLLLTGSGVYVVMYSSTTLWTACIAVCSGTAVLSGRQWIGVLCLTAGLTISGHAQLQHSSHTAAAVGGGRALLGSAMIVAGSLLHATFFVLADRLLRPPPGSPTGIGGHQLHAVSAVELSCALGLVELVILLVYNSCVVSAFGGVNDIVLAPIAAAAVSTKSDGDAALAVAGLYAALAVVNGIHAGVFFVLLKKLGAVRAALMKALQTLLVVGFSAVYSCSALEPLQCMDKEKGLSVACVLTGFHIYGSGGRSGESAVIHPPVAVKRAHGRE